MPVIKRVTLTKIIVESAVSKPMAYRIWDAKVPGLAMRILPSGRGTFEAHWGRNRSTALGQRGVMTLEAAREAARCVLADRSLSFRQVQKSVSPSQVSLGEFLAIQYGPHVQATAKAGDATVLNIKKQFGHLYQKALSSVSRADFDEFKAKRLRSGIKPSTVNRDLDRIKALLSKAVEWNLITSNPLLGVKRITRNVEGRVRYLSASEEAALRSSLEAREARRRAGRESANQWRKARTRSLLEPLEGYTCHLAPMVLLALNTGLRRGELTQLLWSDINLSARRLVVRAGYAKSGRARHIPLNSEAVEVLRRCSATKKTLGPIFSVKSVAKAWGGVITEAKIERFRFHDLRHTFASNLVMGGVDLNTVRELLGHSDLAMTLRYAHLAPEHKAAAVEVLVQRGRLPTTEAMSLTAFG